MVSKVLTCKTTLAVLSIIDKKIELIKKKTSDRSVINGFLETSIIALKRANGVNTEPDQFSKIRSAIDHLETLRMQYKTF